VENEYIEYSSICDDFTTYIVGRDEALAEWGADRIERCDRSNITSEFGYPNPHCLDVETYLCCNRADQTIKGWAPKMVIDSYVTSEGESVEEGMESYHMTVEQIREHFKYIPENTEKEIK